MASIGRPKTGEACAAQHSEARRSSHAEGSVSEQIISKSARLERLRSRCEQTYDQVYHLFLSKPAAVPFEAMAMEFVGAYEAAKASAAITLSSKIFHQVNPSLSVEWDKVKVDLGI